MICKVILLDEFGENATILVNTKININFNK